MTFVIRITLSLLAVVTLVSVTAEAEAQVLRRLRENIRNTLPLPLPGPLGPQIPGQLAPRQQLPPQLAPQPGGQQFGQTLTPYSRLAPEQRRVPVAAPMMVRSAPAVVRNAPAVVRNNPINQNAAPDRVKVRVITYYDPGSGRTFQRRYVLPNGGSVPQNGNQQQFVRSNAPQAVPTQRVYDKIPRTIIAPTPQQLTSRPSPVVAPQPRIVIRPLVQNQPRSVIQPQPVIQQQPVYQPQPVIQPQTVVQQAPLNTQQMPFFPGQTTVAAKPITASPIYTTPSIQSPIQYGTQQVAPSPRITITGANEPVVEQNEIRVDAAVAPATATDSSDVNNGAIVIGSANSDDGASTTFSVLDGPSDDAVVEPAVVTTPAVVTEPAAVTEAPDLELEVNSSDDVEAFFNN